MSLKDKDRVGENLEEANMVYVVALQIYRLLFPSLLRRKVKSEFKAETWLEFCNRFAGVGLIMLMFGIVSVVILEARVFGDIASNSIIIALSSFYGMIFLFLIWSFLMVVSLVADGGISLPFTPNSSRADIVHNLGRVLGGLVLIYAPYWLLHSSNYPPNQTLIERIVEMIAMIGIGSLFLGPVFYGFALICRGGFELYSESQWRDRSWLL